MVIPGGLDGELGSTADSRGVPDIGFDGGLSADRVLVVEDDPTVAEVVSRYLRREGFAVESVADGAVALRQALADLPALVVLDLMLPGLDGLEVCRRLRAVAPIPVVMLTARGDEEDRVVGLELGADDYLAKPFSPRELTARVKAVLRRAREPFPGTIPVAQLSFGEVEIDLASREVRTLGELAPLTAREFDLLTFLARSPRRTYRREELLERVWGFTYGDTATVTVHMRRLREKVESDPSAPRHLVTVWGVGYRFDP
jgi:DNA-binding response OmpR family regulator